MVGCDIVGGGRWIFDGVGFYGGGDGFLVMVVGCVLWWCRVLAMGVVVCGFMVVEGCGCGGMWVMVVEGCGCGCAGTWERERERERERDTEMN